MPMTGTVLDTYYLELYNSFLLINLKSFFRFYKHNKFTTSQ